MAKRGSKKAGSKVTVTGTTGAKKRGAKKAGASKRSARMIYAFGAKTDGDGSMKELLGGKGANLAAMTEMGLPVPPGFTITTRVCADYHAKGKALPEGLMDGVGRAMRALEKQRGKRFGDESDPLLVSVRSGAARSMPGMMDTILNLGLTDRSVEGLARVTGNARFAYDAYRRLIGMFGDVVMGVDHGLFEAELSAVKRERGVAKDTDVDAAGLKDLCARYKRVYKSQVGRGFPQDPQKQLELAIRAVFDSWDTDRAVRYRRIEGMTGLLGTAVNVQSMVFGNTGDDSATGVAFTRNPSTGEDVFYGEFLVNAQGEDVVAGIRTPEPIGAMKDWNKDVYKQLVGVKETLEAHYRDMQDIEFTVERGVLYMLQTRTGKRTGAAAVRIACDLVKSRRVTRREALMRIPAGDLIQLLLPSFDPAAAERADVIATGLPASPGAAVGRPAFSAAEAVARAGAGEKVILVRKDTSPEDVDGMHTAAGILTSTGGMTSHAAVVARGWGKCCVSGAGSIVIDESDGTFRVGERVFGRDITISIDGSTGRVMLGAVGTVEPEMGGDFATVMSWSDKERVLGVRANADTPEDARRARALGAEGIGLCRTEHMFFGDERIALMRRMILSRDSEERVAALAALEPMQREDFVGIFGAMDGLPVTVRLLDPPLHEFLPGDPATVSSLADAMGVTHAEMARRIGALHETNPMLGHRGCRLAITYPEILDMQVRAITLAAIECAEQKVRARPEIMIPLVGVRKELAVLRERAEGVIARTRKEAGFKGRLTIPIGTMIEVPRAALTAGEIAREADFFSFGTNDLTQLTFGYSRDDVNTFLPGYLAQDILPGDPFSSLDMEGVGRLVSMACEDGRAANAGLKLGICGEHGGDPASVRFCHGVGLGYVSCSSFRVPIARLAAAQAAIGSGG
jgi:pyruvate,orthophosphate dikinase